MLNVEKKENTDPDARAHTHTLHTDCIWSKDYVEILQDWFNLPCEVVKTAQFWFWFSLKAKLMEKNVL